MRQVIKWMDVTCFSSQSSELWNSVSVNLLLEVYIYIYFKLHGLSPRANYTDRATVACRRSDCQLFADRGCHVISVTDPYGRILGFLDRSFWRYILPPSSGSTLRMEAESSCETLVFRHSAERRQSEQPTHLSGNLITYVRHVFLADDRELHFPLDDEKMLLQFLRPCKYYPKSAYEKVSNGGGSIWLVQ
jgi:hypothetical protein